VTRNRHSGLSDPEAVLGRVIRALQTDDGRPADIDPKRWPALLATYHEALMDLLAHGPLRCDEAVAREQETTPLRPELAIIRLELLQLIGSTIQGGTYGGSSSRIELIPSPVEPIAMTVRVVEGRAEIAATGDTRSLVILQIVLLLQEVGLANVHECSASDCRRLFVKVYRREFCSVQCQKRINTRKQRQIAREQKERLARQRRQRRKKGI
jgi:hypothetical protein